MTRTPRALLTILSLLAAACAPASAPLATLLTTGGSELTVERVNEQSLIVRVPRPTHAYLLTMGGEQPEAVRMENDGAPTVLASGRHRVSLSTHLPSREPVSNGPLRRPNRNDRRYCGRDDERLSYGGNPPSNVPSSSVRPVRVRGARAWCVRSQYAAYAGAQPRSPQVLLLASDQPIEPGVLAAAVRDANERYTNIPVGDEEIAGAVAVALAGLGVAAYHVYLP
jgi:hypothetical protein